MISEIHIPHSESKLFAELILLFPEWAGKKYENWSDFKDLQTNFLMQIYIFHCKFLKD